MVTKHFNTPDALLYDRLEERRVVSILDFFVKDLCTLFDEELGQSFVIPRY